MTCGECEEILLDTKTSSGGRGRIFAAPELSMAEWHARSCARCGAKVAAIRSLNSVLEQYRISTTNLSPKPGAEAELLSAFRAETARHRQSSALQLWPRIAWAGFAIAFIVLCAWLYFISPLSGLRTRRNLTIRPTIADTVNRNSGGARSLRAETRNALGSVTQAGAVRAKRSHLRSARQEDPNSGTASGSPAAYLDAEYLTRGAGGNIVRVVLPSSTLVAFGVPFHANGADQQMTADVVVDSFGVVRGIWLVGTTRE